jgi:hypothetical protein
MEMNRCITAPEPLQVVREYVDRNSSGDLDGAWTV